MNTVLRAAITGSVASIAVTGVLALLAKTERKGALQPMNATSHWLHGDKAGAVAKPDVAHTAVGYATHHASAVFWALLFEAWLGRNAPRSPLRLLRDAAALSAIAAAVDYGITPRRLTPGWEIVLPASKMVAAFAALAAGLAAGATLTRALAPAPRRRLRQW
jgi:hypothetical protein